MNVKVPFFDGWLKEEIDPESTQWERFVPYLPFFCILVFGVGFSVTTFTIMRKKRII